jgi:hypothetical protein
MPLQRNNAALWMAQTASRTATNRSGQQSYFAMALIAPAVKYRKDYRG